MPTAITSSGITFDDATTQTTSALAAGAIGTTQLASAAVTPAKLSQPLTLATAVATTSGTSIDFTGIPSWVRRITVMLKGVSTNGSSLQVVRLGTSAGVVASGYVGANWISNTTNLAYSTGVLVNASTGASSVWSGIVALILQDSATNTWVASVVTGDSGGTNASHGGGHVSLSGTLDRIRLTTVNGTDTFDAGSVNIIYEG